MQLQVGVKALIQNDAGLYLFIERAEKLPDGSGIRWDVPGGRIQPGETLQAALAREVSEEAGMELSGEPELLAAQDIIVPEGGIHVVRLTYKGKATGQPHLSNEHQGHRWATLAEARELNVDNYLRQTLARL